jgi:hypothetical protein
MELLSGLVHHTSVGYEPHPFLPITTHSTFISLLSIASEISKDVHTCEQTKNHFINILLVFHLLFRNRKLEED